jgi:hypothetical protein
MHQQYLTETVHGTKESKVAGSTHHRHSLTLKIQLGLRYWVVGFRGNIAGDRHVNADIVASIALSGRQATTIADQVC